MPTFLLYHDGRPLEHNGRVRGADIQSLRSAIESHYATVSGGLDTEDMKSVGNGFLKMGTLDEAVHWYTQAIGRRADQPALYSNRSAAHTAMGNHVFALLDADKALEIDDNFAKGYLRQASALLALHFIEEAKQSVQRGLEIDPESAALQKLQDEIMIGEQKQREISNGNVPSFCLCLLCCD